MKSKCNKCKKEIDILPIRIAGKEYINNKQLCDDCADKLNNEIEQQQRDKKREENYNTLPKKFRYLEDKYKFKIKAKSYKDKNLYLYGSTGARKSALATFILKELWDLDKEGKFVSFPEFIFDLQTDYDTAKNKVESLKRYPDCLVIDDFGAEKMTDFVRQCSYLIIDYREQNELQTIITSNYDLKKIDEYIDSRISSRITGMCGKEFIIDMGDKDFRCIK